MEERKVLVKPGYFSVQAAADSRRDEFDIGNEIILEHGLTVDFVFAGDSITHFWDLNVYFGGKGRFIVNRGIAGDTTDFLLRRFEADVIQLKPKIAVLMIGTNNTWVMDRFRPDDSKAREDLKMEMLKNIHEMVSMSMDNNQKLVLCSILPTDIYPQVNNRMRNELIAEMNKEIKAMAESSGLIFIDYHSHMTGEDGLTLRPELADDGVHPHVKGYNLMSVILRETLNDNGIEI